jgi:hypothetical protein
VQFSIATFAQFSDVLFTFNDDLTRFNADPSTSFDFSVTVPVNSPQGTPVMTSLFTWFNGDFNAIEFVSERNPMIIGEFHLCN